jgi:predicted DsbA family dithiol-disulfide isomerase
VDTLRVEIWSDVACPWCYIGKRRWERALEASDAADKVETTWRSFELDPTIPKGVRRPHDESLVRKYGASAEQIRAMNERVVALAAAEGLHYDFRRYVRVSTLDAHRVAHLARTHGLGAEMHERLFRAQLVEGEVLDDPETLARLAAEVGVPAEETRAMLATDGYLDDVRAEGQLGHALGATGVPFFVFGRRFAVSGAQPSELFAEALRRARDDVAPVAGM